MMPTEQWAPVVGWEGLYEVSDQGRHRSLDRTTTSLAGVPRKVAGRVMKLKRLKTGHTIARMCRPGEPNVEKLIHRLVLEAFVGPCPTGMEGCHNNGDPTDNRLANLRWDTHAENQRDILRHGRHYFKNKTHCKRNHKFTAANTRLKERGYRECRECDRLRGSHGNRIKRSEIAS